MDKKPIFNRLLKDTTIECDDYYQMLNRIDTWCELCFCLYPQTKRLGDKIREQISTLQVRHGRMKIIKVKKGK